MCQNRGTPINAGFPFSSLQTSLVKKVTLKNTTRISLYIHVELLFKPVGKTILVVNKT